MQSRWSKSTDNLDQIVSEAKAAFAASSDPDALEQVKARFLGKSGQITELLKGLGKLPPEENKTAGAAINVAKTAVENALNERREDIRKAALQARLAEEALDVTLPGRAEARGGLHPVTRTLERIESLFASIGFDLGAFAHFQADRAEEVLDALQRARHRMQAAARLTASGQRDIERDVLRPP